MNVKSTSARLTRQMSAALELLAGSGDRAFHRTWSHWWVRESSLVQARMLGPEHRDLEDGLQAPPAFWNDQEAVTVVRTATVNALVARGFLKFTGQKRRVISSAPTKAYWRAELTAAGLSFRAHLVDTTAEATNQLLRRVTAKR
jgi:hypothetical protein